MRFPRVAKKCRDLVSFQELARFLRVTENAEIWRDFRELAENSKFSRFPSVAEIGRNWPRYCDIDDVMVDECR